MYRAQSGFTAAEDPALQGVLGMLWVGFLKRLEVHPGFWHLPLLMAILDSLVAAPWLLLSHFFSFLPSLIL